MADNSGLKLPLSANLQSCHDDIRALQSQLQQAEKELTHQKALNQKMKEQQVKKDQEFLQLKTAIKQTLADSEKAILEQRQKIKDLQKENKDLAQAN